MPEHVWELERKYDDDGEEYKCACGAVKRVSKESKSRFIEVIEPTRGVHSEAGEAEPLLCKRCGKPMSLCSLCIRRVRSGDRHPNGMYCHTCCVPNGCMQAHETPEPVTEDDLP